MKIMKKHKNKLIGGILLLFGISFFFTKFEKTGEYVISYICGILCIIFGIKFILKKDIVSDENITANKIEKPIALYEKEIKVAGTSYHQNELKQIASNGVNNHYISSYQEMTTKEIKEYGRVGQIEYEKLKAIQLIPYEFEDKPAIKVLVNNYEGEFIEIGNVPKEEVSELLHYIEEQDNFKFIVDGYFVGGKYKEYDLYDKKMKTEELNIGIRLKIKIINK